MATYIVLSSFTDQGVRTVKDTTKRSDAVRELAKDIIFGQMRVKRSRVHGLSWHRADPDDACIFEGRDVPHCCQAGLER